MEYWRVEKGFNPIAITPSPQDSIAPHLIEIESSHAELTSAELWTRSILTLHITFSLSCSVWNVNAGSSGHHAANKPGEFHQESQSGSI